MSKNKSVGALAAVMLLSTISLSACTTIGPGERGIKVTMGKMDKHLMTSGFVTYNPLMEDVHMVSVKQTTITGKASPLTADQQAIDINYNVLFSIPEDKVLTLFEKYNGNPFDSLVAPQIQEAFRQVVSQYKSDQATKNINIIRNQVLAMVQENLKGLVTVVDIPITHVELPEVLRKAIATKQVMEQQALQKVYELDKANREAQITVAQAKAQAESQLVQAQAAAKGNLATAEAEAKGIQLKNDAIKKSPQIIEYVKAQKWNGALPNFMFNGSGGESGKGLNTILQIIPPITQAPAGEQESK